MKIALALPLFVASCIKATYPVCPIGNDAIDASVSDTSAVDSEAQDAATSEDATVEAEDATIEPEDASVLVSGPTAWAHPEASWGRPCTETDPCSSIPEALALQPSQILIYSGTIQGPLARDWARSSIRIASVGGRVTVHSDLSSCIRRAEGVVVEDVEIEGLDCHGLGTQGQQPCIDWRGVPGARGLVVRRVTCLGYPSAVEAPRVPGVVLEDVTLGGLAVDGGSPPTDAGPRSDARPPEDASVRPVDAGTMTDRLYSPRLVEPPLPTLR